MHKAEKKGPELLMPTPALMETLKNIAKICKENRDNFNYENMNTAISILSKWIASSIQNKETITLERMAAKALIESADWKEQLYPLLTSCEGCKYQKGRHCIIEPGNHCSRKAEDMYILKDECQEKSATDAK